MDYFVVHSELAASVVDDQDTHTAASIGKRVIESRPQATLVNDRKALLDISGLSHCNHTAIIANVEDTILLEDGTEHVLNNDRRRWVGDETGLLMELLGEEINSEVAMLAGLSRSGNADDLAGAALKDQEITNADVVTRDGNGIGSSTTLDITYAFTDALTDAGWSTILLVNDYLLTLGTMTMGMERVKDAVGCFLNAVTEGVVATLIIIITHLGRWINGCFRFDSYFFARCGSSTLVFDVVGWLDASAVVAFSCVNLFVAMRHFDINFRIGVALIAWLTITMMEDYVSPLQWDQRFGVFRES